MSDGALAFQGSSGVEMTDGDGEGVRGVERFRRLGEFEQTGDHSLNLLFLGAPVTYDGRLDG